MTFTVDLVNGSNIIASNYFRVYTSDNSKSFTYACNELRKLLTKLNKNFEIVYEKSENYTRAYFDIK